MSEATWIQDELRRAFEGDAWHGPSLREVLAGVSASEAAARPVPNAHTIWEIVLHLSAWQETVRRRLEGEPLKEPPQGDWPAPPEPSEEAWQDALGALDRAHRDLLDVVARLDESRIEQPIAPGSASTYVTLHGTAQHHAYHAGQIVLLKKPLSSVASS